VSQRSKYVKTFILVLGVTVSMQGCCFPPRKEPPVPQDVVGWKDYQEGTTRYRGRFLLRKGESTDNGKVRIKVLELVPPDCMSDAGSYERLARVKLQFSSVSDPKLACSVEFNENGGGNLFPECAVISNAWDISSVYVAAINLKDGWVFFIVDGTY
jgi:hypothetical protein